MNTNITKYLWNCYLNPRLILEPSWTREGKRLFKLKQRLQYRYHLKRHVGDYLLLMIPPILIAVGEICKALTTICDDDSILIAEYNNAEMGTD